MGELDSPLGLLCSDSCAVLPRSSSSSSSHASAVNIIVYVFCFVM